MKNENKQYFKDENLLRIKKTFRNNQFHISTITNKDRNIESNVKYPLNNNGFSIDHYIREKIESVNNPLIVSQI